MSYMKLIKLLYLADRESLMTRGRPITFDKFCAMPHGMVLSGTLDLINGEEPGPNWNECFELFGNHEVKLKHQPSTVKLSKAELKILDSVFERFGRKTRWEIRDFTHTLPEWSNPKGSSMPVEFSDVLKHSERTPAEIESIKDELVYLDALASIPSAVAVAK